MFFKTNIELIDLFKFSNNDKNCVYKWIHYTSLSCEKYTFKTHIHLHWRRVHFFHCIAWTLFNESFLSCNSSPVGNNENQTRISGTVLMKSTFIDSLLCRSKTKSAETKGCKHSFGTYNKGKIKQIQVQMELIPCYPSSPFIFQSWKYSSDHHYDLDLKLKTDFKKIFFLQRFIFSLLTVCIEIRTNPLKRHMNPLKFLGPTPWILPLQINPNRALFCPPIMRPFF